MLLTMGNAEKTTPLVMIGPKGLSKVVNALRVVAPELPFEIEFVEIAEPEQSFLFEGFRIEAFRVNHNVLCYGYNIVIDRKGKFQLDKAMALALDRRYWSRLQKGETISYRWLSREEFLDFYDNGLSIGSQKGRLKEFVESIR